MHHIYRVRCFTKTCRNCNNAVFVKNGFWGDRLYMCPASPKKHKEIDGRDCGKFRCSDYGEFSLCKECSGGAPIKRLRRY